MATGLTSDKITFRITWELGNDPKDISFTDLIAGAYDTTYGLTLSNIKGLIKIVSPSGTAIYTNAGWAADDFSSPDIEGATPTWSKTGMALALDSADKVEQGVYLFYYKLSTDGSALAFTVENTFTYTHDSPVISIDMSVSCRTSELTSDDATDYDVDNITPTVTRAHALTKPTGAGCTMSLTATNEKTRVVGGGGASTTDIWTKIWQTTLTSTLVYEYEDWNSLNWILVNDSVSGHDSINVECDDCGCNIRACVIALQTKWLNAVGGGEGRARADELGEKVLKVLNNWMLYNQAERCGDDSEEYCEAIAAIVISEDCQCSSADTISEHVVAWADSVGGGGSGTSVAFYNGAADPTIADPGVNGDYYFETTNWQLWYKTGGTWTNLGSFKGADGAAGSGYYQILSNSIVDVGTAASAAVQTLKSYTLPGDSLGINGSYVKATSILELATNSAVRTISVNFGGDDVASIIVAATVQAKTKYLKIELNIDRITASTQLVECTITRAGVPGSVMGAITIEDAEALGSDQDILITGQTADSGVDDIIAKSLKVEMFTKPALP